MPFLPPVQTHLPLTNLMHTNLMSTSAINLQLLSGQRSSHNIIQLQGRQGRAEQGKAGRPECSRADLLTPACRRKLLPAVVIIATPGYVRFVFYIVGHAWPSVTTPSFGCLLEHRKQSHAVLLQEKTYRQRVSFCTCVNVPNTVAGACAAS